MTMLNEGEIQDSDVLRDIGIDSLGYVDLIIKLEDQFSIAFDDSDLNIDNLSTVESIVKLVERYI